MLTGAPPPLLELRGLTRRFGGLAAADGVDLALAEGGLLCVIGPNGCGKTTLFNLIGGELAPTSGEIRLAGARIDGLKPFEIARRGVLRKFQVPGVYADLSVAENLRIAAHSRRLRQGSSTGAASTFSRASVGEGARRADEGRAAEPHDVSASRTPGALAREPSSGASRPLLPRDRGRREDAALLDIVRLAHRRDALAGELPHGERQWLEIAMVVAAGPRLMLLDEPTTGMTAEETRATARLVRELHAATGTAAIVIEHDMAFVAALGAPCAFMLRGRIALQGSFEEVRAAPLVHDAYLGAAGDGRQGPDG